MIPTFDLILQGVATDHVFKNISEMLILLIIDAIKSAMSPGFFLCQNGVSVLMPLLFLDFSFGCGIIYTV